MFTRKRRLETDPPKNLGLCWEAPGLAWRGAPGTDSMLGDGRTLPVKKQDTAHEPECTSLCANPRKIERTFFGVSQWGSQSSLLRKLCFSACKTVLCALHLLLDLRYKVAIFQPELRALDLRYTAAIVQLELNTCTWRTRLALHSCDFQAGAQNLYFAYYTCTSKLRSSSQS